MSEVGPNGPNYRLMVSRFTGSEQWDRALETAREWLGVEPESPQAHMAAGQALLNLKRYKESVLHIEKVLASQPWNGTAHRFMSIAYFHQKQFKQADEEIQKAISQAPHDYYNWYQIAWMFYRNGDAASARRYAEKAREINPRNPAALNLLALCTPNNPAAAAQRLRQYEEALELDPENAEVHNNIGVHRLNVEKNYEAAEQCFRRALFFDPRYKVAQKNLFLTIKHRDKVYRLLCMPRDGMNRLFGGLREARRKSWLLYLLCLPLWFVVARYAIAIFILWFLLVWPMVKVYEFLTVGDLRADAGEVGSRRGGFLNYRQWPVRVRLSIFAACLVSFWSAIGWLVYSGLQSSADNPPNVGVMILAGAAVVFLIVFGVMRVRSMIMRSEARGRARARARRLAAVLDTKMDVR